MKKQHDTQREVSLNCDESSISIISRLLGKFWYIDAESNSFSDNFNYAQAVIWDFFTQ